MLQWLPNLTPHGLLSAAADYVQSTRNLQCAAMPALSSSNNNHNSNNSSSSSSSSSSPCP
jgi:hypothetical protein